MSANTDARRRELLQNLAGSSRIKFVGSYECTELSSVAAHERRARVASVCAVCYFIRMLVYALDAAGPLGLLCVDISQVPSLIPSSAVHPSPPALGRRLRGSSAHLHVDEEALDLLDGVVTHESAEA